MATITTIDIPAGGSKTVTSDAVFSGSYHNANNKSDTTALSASSSVKLGPFTKPRQYVFTVNSGNISITDQVDQLLSTELGVSATVPDDLSVDTITTTGNATIGGDAAVTGNVTCVDMDASGSATVGTTFGVTGAVTFDSDLDVGGTLSVTGATDVDDLSVGGNLTYLRDVNNLTANDTVDATFQNQLIMMNVSGGGTITLPQDSDYDAPIGFTFDVVRNSSETAALAAGTGATLVSAGSADTLTAQYSACTVTKVAADTWYAVGDLS